MNYSESSAMNHIGSSVLDMTKMSDRFQEALDRRGTSAPEVIRGTKLSKGTIYNILNGTTSPEKIWGATAKKLSAYLRISSDWLLSGRGSMDDMDAGTDADWPEITATTQGASLGAGMSLEAYTETHKLKFRSSSLERKGLRPQHLEVYYGRGDSMEPRIRNGDAILVDKSDTRVVDDRIYFIRHDGHYFVKRLQQHGDVTLVLSDNRDDPQWRKPLMVQPSDDFEVLGRVRWIGSWED